MKTKIPINFDAFTTRAVRRRAARRDVFVSLITGAALGIALLAVFGQL